MAEVANIQDIEQLVELAATDNELFSTAFFPRTCRMRQPLFHKRVWSLLEVEQSRFVSLQLFRGGGKTTLLRLFTAKRIAYGLSRTVLYIGKSEGHAIRSVDWIRRQVQFNTEWASIFGLRPGGKFQGTEAEIVNEADGSSTWILAAGIEGSIRGINIDDYRPDLIILDDVVADDNAATPEGRQKMKELILGAVKESLAPPGECPHAKMVMLNTPIALDDASMETLSDPEWVAYRFGCWTKETEDLAVDEQVSAWEERFPTPVLRQEKRYALQRGQGHIFAREKECRIIAPETAPLKRVWMQFPRVLPSRKDLTVVVACDPVPKPTPAQIAKNLHGKDYEVFQAWGRRGSDLYLLDYLRNRGHDPSWTIWAFFTMLTKWRPRTFVFDAQAYQSTLSWIIEQEMKRRRQFCLIEEVRDNRSKFDKIVDAYSGPAALGHLWLKEDYPDFLQQWEEYPNVAHDDDLDCGHLAVDYLTNRAILEDMEDYPEDDVIDVEPIRYEEACP